MKTVRDYKLEGFSFILNKGMMEPHWEVARRKCHCKLCGRAIKKGEKRFAVEVDFDHSIVSTYLYIFVRFYFCEKPSVKEIGEALCIDLSHYCQGLEAF